MGLVKTYSRFNSLEERGEGGKGEEEGSRGGAALRAPCWPAYWLTQGQWEGNSEES